MSPKFQKRSELEFVGRIIPRAKLRGTIDSIIGRVFGLSNVNCVFFLILGTVNDMPHFIFKPIHIDESENSENQ